MFKVKFVAAIVAALFVGAAQAGTSVLATSGASVGSLSVTGNFGNGIAVQGTKVGASNSSTATAIKIGPTVITNAATGGGTASASAGFAFGAFGATGGFALQGGTAAAAAW